MITNILVDRKTVTVQVYGETEVRGYQLRNRGTHFSIYCNTVNGEELATRLDVSTGAEAYIRRKWKTI